MSSEFSEWLRLAQEAQDRARVKRTRGDALRKLGKIEEAKKAYRAAAQDFREPLDALPETTRNQILDRWPLEPMEQARREVVDELVELYGSLGGVLRRSEDSQDALASYEWGSTIERRFNLVGTYNRLNAIKSNLLLHRSTLGELQQDLKELARHIEQQLATDSALSDSGWAWADLGDCRILTGDFDGARQAYRTFVSKSETRSPAVALGVLTQVSRTLEGASDPEALQAVENIERLKSEFA